MENSLELMTQTKCLPYEVQFTMVLLTKKCFSQSHLARMVYDISYQVRWKSRVKLSDNCIIGDQLACLHLSLTNRTLCI